MGKYKYFSKNLNESFIVEKDSGQVLTIEKTLGQGSYGDVRLFSSSEGAKDKRFAVKRFRKHYSNTEIKYGTAYWEYKMLKRARPNSETEFFINGNNCRLIMPYYNMDTLFSLTSEGILSKEVAIKIIILTLEIALEIYLTTGVLHIDLNPNNIMLTINASNLSIDAIEIIDWGGGVAKDMNPHWRDIYRLGAGFLADIYLRYYKYSAPMNKLKFYAKAVYDLDSYVVFYKNCINLFTKEVRSTEWKIMNNDYLNSNTHLSYRQNCPEINNCGISDLIFLARGAQNSLSDWCFTGVNKAELFQNIILYLHKMKHNNDVVSISNEIIKNIASRIIKTALITRGMNRHAHTKSGVFLCNEINGNKNLKSLLFPEYNRNITYSDLASFVRTRQEL